MFCLLLHYLNTLLILFISRLTFFRVIILSLRLLHIHFLLDVNFMLSSFLDLQIIVCTGNSLSLSRPQTSTPSALAQNMNTIARDHSSYRNPIGHLQNANMPIFRDSAFNTDILVHSDIYTCNNKGENHLIKSTC